MHRLARHDRRIKVGGTIGVALIALRLFFEEQVVNAAQWVATLVELGPPRDRRDRFGRSGNPARCGSGGGGACLCGLPPEVESKPTELASTPLTKEERDLIQPIRIAWKLPGDHATFALQSLFSEVIYPLRDRRYWAAAPLRSAALWAWVGRADGYPSCAISLPLSKAW